MRRTTMPSSTPLLLLSKPSGMRSDKQLVLATFSRSATTTAVLPCDAWSGIPLIVCALQFTRLIDWGVPLFGLLSINWRENGVRRSTPCLLL